MVRFFERILAEQRATPDHIPPYLFTHPEVEARIAAVNAQAGELKPTVERAPDLDAELREAQARLALLIDTNRATLPGPPPPDRALSDPLLAEAEQLAATGQIDAALLVLARAEAAEPNDPRVPFRVGELLASQGRHAEAIAAYRRTVRLDPTHALVFFKLGRSYREIGERHRAVYAFEQASLRAGPGNVLQRRAEWEVEKLTFAIVPESGVSAGDALAAAARPAPASQPVLSGEHPPDRVGGRGSGPASFPMRRRSGSAGSPRTATSCRTRQPIARASPSSPRASRSTRRARGKPARGPSRRASTTT